MYDFLQALQIDALNGGALCGEDLTAGDKGGRTLDSINPATAQPIAQIRMASAAHYEQVIQRSQKAFASWRSVPAPSVAKSCGRWPCRCAITRRPWASW